MEDKDGQVRSTQLFALKEEFSKLNFHWNGKLESLIKHLGYYEKGVCVKIQIQFRQVTTGIYFCFSYFPVQYL